ncbi:MAG: ATP synthase F0 subunit C [Candidatus Margulisiibacteriota bacterium]|nr:ATP synthase F0 subunit C [Candidatus Margulisiibacteriota bacterium]
MNPEAAGFLSSGLSIGLASLGCGIGIGIVGAKAMEAISRQPEIANSIRVSMIVVIAFIEAIALYALVVSFILLTK